MNGLCAGNLDAMGVLLDLPNYRNLTIYFSRHNTFVAETLRSIAGNKMDLTLAMEIKAILIHNKSDEYYEC